MYPDQAVRFPFHPCVHFQNDVFIHLKIGITFGPGVFIGHIAQALTGQTGDDKPCAFQVKLFAWPAVHAIAALLGFSAGQGGGNEFCVSYQAVN